MLNFYAVYGEDTRRCFDVVNINEIELALSEKQSSVAILTNHDSVAILNDVCYVMLNAKAHNWMATGNCLYSGKKYRGELSVCPQHSTYELVLKLDPDPLP